MPSYPLILERLLNTPLLAHPAKAELVAGVVLRRAGLEVSVAADPMGAQLGPVQERVLSRKWIEREGEKTFLFGDGVAVIEVTGSLAHRQWHVRESSGITGYDGIGAQLGDALADPAVRAILIDVHSPGGEASGCFALADRIFAARGVKPIVAIADEMAFSAAYALAAACDEVFLASDTAWCGSVGAVTVHYSFERLLKGEGVKPTIFQSGARKTEGNPLFDLTPEAAERMQAEIDELGRLFRERVARWRGLSEAAVRATEAATFMGQAAIDVGFADGIAAAEEVFIALSSATAPV